jgi:flavin reductase (DIM6/NTAB) family NADH-FMN oxidoreductase RutF
MPVSNHAMFIVTARAAHQMSGCLVGFVTQCSIDPPRYLVCLSVRNHTFPVARAADVLAVHMASAERSDLARLFGAETGDEVDKFSRCTWSRGPHGSVLLDGLGNWFVGTRLASWPVGDHHAFLLEPVSWSDAPDERPLMFRDVAGLQPGHAP